MRIFITGSAGFIGTRLVRFLSGTNHKLYCFDKKPSNNKLLEASGAKIITGDINDKKCLLQEMRGCDWLVHLASSFEFWVPDQQVYRDANVDGVRNVMEVALEVGIRKVVHVSTAAVFGNAPWPISEESQYGDYRPSRYAQTKFEGEMIAWRMYEEKGLPLVVIYPSTVIGANDPKAAGRYIETLALGRMPIQVLVNTVFPFVHVKDVCKAIIRSLEKRGNIGEKYLVSAANMTFGDMNRIICEITGNKVPTLRLPDAMTVACAHFLTGISRIIKTPPPLDLSVDQIALMKLGSQLDGSKAERELGLVYTPIYEALSEAVASLSL
jgi:dihydroflavonol-4-reductase